jgi:ferrous iron transport protein B
MKITIDRSAINQVDIAEGKGIHIDSKKLSEHLGIPVIPTVGTKNIGIARARRGCMK